MIDFVEDCVCTCGHYKKDHILLSAVIEGAPEGMEFCRPCIDSSPTSKSIFDQFHIFKIDNLNTVEALAKVRGLI